MTTGSEKNAIISFEMWQGGHIHSCIRIACKFFASALDANTI